jgi:DNA-binding protein Fis
MINESEMARMVRRAIDGYFKDLDGERAIGVYDMVISCVEKPLLESVLHRVRAIRPMPRGCWASIATLCARKCGCRIKL